MLASEVVISEEVILAAGRETVVAAHIYKAPLSKSTHFSPLMGNRILVFLYTR